MTSECQRASIASSLRPVKSSQTVDGKKPANVCQDLNNSTDRTGPADRHDLGPRLEDAARHSWTARAGPTTDALASISIDAAPLLGRPRDVRVNGGSRPTPVAAAFRPLRPPVVVEHLNQSAQQGKAATGSSAAQHSELPTGYRAFFPVSGVLYIRQCMESKKVNSNLLMNRGW